MIIHLSIHRPKPDKEADLVASMHRFAAAAAGLPGVHRGEDAARHPQRPPCRHGALGG